MQNTAAIVFQGEAEWGWLRQQHGDSPGPVCSLSGRPPWRGGPGSVSGCPVLSTSLQFVCETFSIKSLCSMLRSLSVFVCSLASPLS